MQMKQPSPRALMRRYRSPAVFGLRFLAVCGLLVALNGAAGCATAKPAATLKLTSGADGRQFEQTFRAARFSRGNSGDVDIVLVDQTEGLSRTLTGRDKPLETTASAPLTHLMHIRVLWKPTRAIRAGAPSASNATIQWTALSRDGGRLDYTGTGFVRLSGNADSIRVSLNRARLSPTHREGDLEDPIGPVTLDATFRAAREDATVATALTMIRHRGEPAPEAGMPPLPAAPFDGPPARSPGP